MINIGVKTSPFLFLISLMFFPKADMTLDEKIDFLEKQYNIKTLRKNQQKIITAILNTIFNDYELFSRIKVIPTRIKYKMIKICENLEVDENEKNNNNMKESYLICLGQISKIIEWIKKSTVENDLKNINKKMEENTSSAIKKIEEETQQKIENIIEKIEKDAENDIKKAIKNTIENTKTGNYLIKTINATTKEVNIKNITETDKNLMPTINTEETMKESVTNAITKEKEAYIKNTIEEIETTKKESIKKEIEKIEEAAINDLMQKLKPKLLENKEKIKKEISDIEIEYPKLEQDSNFNPPYYYYRYHRYNKHQNSNPSQYDFPNSKPKDVHNYSTNEFKETDYKLFDKNNNIEYNNFSLTDISLFIVILIAIEYYLYTLIEEKKNKEKEFFSI